MKKIISLALLCASFASIALAQSPQPWSLSTTKTENLNILFSMGPDDNVPDTMHLSGGAIVYDKAAGSITFFTATKAIVKTNLIGEITYISKGSFMYHWNNGDEAGSYGSRKLTATEAEKYIQPIVIEVEQME